MSSANPRLYTIAPSLFRESASLINGFPAEILSMIFKIIHSDLLEYGDHWKEVSDDELAGPSLFPYSISTVCRYWDAVMASFAEFWTRIVVCIDQPDHQELLKLSLDRSQSLEPHSISVIRSSQDNSLIDPLEKVKVQDVLRILSGHYSRLQALVIQTLTTDSLPTCVRIAWGLQTLRLESLQRGPRAAPPNPIALSNDDVDCGDLAILSLTGPIFVTLWRNERWRQALQNTFLESLTIAHLRAEDGGEKPFTFQELWESFRNLNSVGHLSWINIDVPYISSAWDRSATDSSYLYTSSLTFDTVPASLLRTFYDHLRLARDHRYPDSGLLQLQKFRNCSFYGCSSFGAFPFSNRIEVSGISNPDSLSLFFEMADTYELLIHDCPGLDDASLNVLGSFPFSRHDQSAALPCMYSLVIRDCPKFSVRVLREFVESRKRCTQSDDWERRGNEIQHLSLVGSCPPLTEEEQEWFKENIEEFENENLA